MTTNVAAASETMDAIEQMGRTRLGRMKMLWVLIVCAAPVVASYVTYYVVKPHNPKTFGHIITPAREMPEVMAQKLNEAEVPLRGLKQQWLLASVSSGACGASCQSALILQRQLREALGREKERVDWVLFLNDEEPITPVELFQSMQTLGNNHRSGFEVLRVPRDVLLAWLGDTSDSIVLIDPMGRYMMRFPANVDHQAASKIRKDIEKLLQGSQSWDAEGRQ